MSADTHTCPCGCGAQIARRLFTCKPGWYRLPKPYRDAINDAWRNRERDNRRAHISAMRAAIIWYRDNSKPVEVSS